MSETLFVAWQENVTRKWHTIAALQRLDGFYELSFTEGAIPLSETLFQLFGMNVNSIYRFPKLIPAFKNKIPNKNRSDYQTMANWVDAKPDEDEFTLLRKFGLVTSNDPLLFYAVPSLNLGVYRLRFFLHSIRYMHDDSIRWSLNAKVGERLLPMLDAQNPVDRDAVAFRTETGGLLVGYAPTFYSHDLQELICCDETRNKIEVRIRKCNYDAPPQLRIMCELQAPVPKNFRPLDTPAHRLLKFRTRREMESTP